MMTNHHHHPRRMLPPGNTRKRKYGAEADKPAEPKAAEPKNSNKLLAGYLAHEFLTKGTLFGQKYEPKLDRADGDGSSEPKRMQPKVQTGESDVKPSRQSERREHESYGEVANIMKTKGTHIKGIVNPTQLSQWIHM